MWTKFSDKNYQADDVNRDYGITEQNEHVQIKPDSESDIEIEGNDHDNNE